MYKNEFEWLSLSIYLSPRAVKLFDNIELFNARDADVIASYAMFKPTLKVNKIRTLITLSECSRWPISEGFINY